MGMRTHGTNGSIHPSPGSQPHSRDAADEQYKRSGGMSNASPYEHDGLAPDARFFSSYRPFFSRPKSKVRAGGFSLQMLMTPLTGHPACAFSAALADAIMEETPPRGVVDDGTMDEENRASGEGLRLRRRRRRKLGSRFAALARGWRLGNFQCKGSSKAAGAERGAGHSSDGASISKHQLLAVSLRVNSDGGQTSINSTTRGRFFFRVLYHCLL